MTAAGTFSHIPRLGKRSKEISRGCRDSEREMRRVGKEGEKERG